MKKIIGVIFAIILVSLLPQVFSQQITIGDIPRQTIKILISEEGDIHVIHDVQKSSKSLSIDVIGTNFSNLVVIDDDGNEVQYAEVSAEKISLTVFPTNEDFIVEYDATGVVELKDELWIWNYVYLATTTFTFPDGVDFIYANERPVPLNGKDGMICHGCEVDLEYVINESISIEEISWENEKFLIGIRALTEISSFNFTQANRSISFEVSEDDQLITLIIPLKLLWNPYEVYLGDQKILKHEFSQNETHAGLSIRPDSSGTIQIIGTSVIPEFPLMIPLFVGLGAVILLQLKSKLNHH